MRRLLMIAAAVLVVGAAATWWVQTRTGPPAPRVGDLSRADAEVVETIEGAAAAVDERPGDRARRLQLGRIYEANGFYDAAAECYEQVVARDRSHGVAWYRLALCRERSGDFQGAIEAMRAAIGRVGDYAPAHVRLALWLADAGELGEAQSAVDHALALAPENRGPHVAQARLLVERGEASEAIALIEAQNLTRGPTAAFVAHLLAAAHRANGNPEAARAALDAVGGLPAPSGGGIEDPWTSELAALRTGLAARQRKAGSLVTAGRHAEALRLLEPLVEADPEDVRLRVMLAQCYLGTRRSDDALRVVTEAVALAPDHFGSNLGYAQVSLSLAGRGADLAQAEQRVDHAIALRPENGTARRVRAEILYALGRVEEAAAGWRDAWRLDARDATPLLRLGYVQLDRSEWEPARATFVEILGSFEADGLALIGRARAEMELGELDAAARTLEQAERSDDPNAAVLEATRARLAELRGAE